MLSLRTLSVPALLTLLVACSEAKFTGNASSRATQPTPPPAADDGGSDTNPGDDDGSNPGTDDGTGPGGDDDGSAADDIRCAIDPGQVKLGGKALIALSAKNKDAQLFQTVIIGSSRTESIIVYGGPETRGLYTKENGSANEIVGNAVGTMTVEIRRDQDQAAADAVCTLNVSKDTVPVTPPLCEDTEHKIGAEIAFLIDNSNSNASTDCPNDRYLGTHNGTDVYECLSETNREKAVMAAYDILRDVAASDSSNALARSRLAIGSFPTAADYVSGWKNESQGFLDVVATGRASVSNALKFTRKPAGMTPYGAAMGGATEVFAKAANDKRAKLAVLVTDGEPTDQAPEAVVAKAAALKAQGVNVVTIFVTAGQARSARESKHIAMMKSIDDTRLAQTNGAQHWFDSRYTSFNAYADALIGGNGQKSLVQRISGKVVEVQNSAALKNAFLEIIKSEIKCEP